MQKFRFYSSWQWLLLIFTAASLVETVFYSQMLAFTPLYLPELGISDEGQILLLVGWITAASNGLGIPFLPFWGALADRYSPKPIIIRSFGVLLLAAILAYFARSVWVFFIARSLTGFALGNSGLMMTTLSERLPEKRQGLGFSIMNSAAPIGAFLGPLSGGFLIDQYGFRTLLLLNMAVLSLIMLLLASGYRYLLGQRRRAYPTDGLGFDAHHRPIQTPSGAIPGAVPSLRWLDAGLYVRSTCDR